MYIHNAKIRAFTLVEIVIVAALIALLSGIGGIAVNAIYIRNVDQIVTADLYQIRTGLHQAETDLIFFPKFSYLTQSVDTILLTDDGDITNGNETLGIDIVVPALDYYGFLNENPRAFVRIRDNWEGPYMAQTGSRKNFNRGLDSGVVKVRLPELVDGTGTGFQINSRDISIVDWPSDPFGNPYVFYSLAGPVEDFGGGTFGVLPSFTNSAGEDGKFFTAVVSYGRNQFPGGNENTPQSFADSDLVPGALFVENDIVTGGEAAYTMRTAATTAFDGSAIATNLILANGSTVHGDVLRALSIKNTDSVSSPIFSIEDGLVGIIDEGTDDKVLSYY